MIPKIIKNHIAKDPQDILSILTPVEREVIAMIADGATTPEMADRTKYTACTIESMRVRLLKKMGAKNVANLVAIAYRNGIIK